MKLKQFFIRWWPVLVWCGLIFIVSAMPINKSQEFSWLDFIFKKTAHVTEYAILFWLVFRAASDRGRLYSKKIFVWSFVFSVLYAFSDEWHQTFVPGREGTLRDVGFDTLGILFSWIRVNGWE